MPKRVVNPKLSPEEEEALLVSLRKQRELKARVLLQAEAQAVARKLEGVAIEKVPEEAAPLVNKDKKNFGTGDQSLAVIAITLNAVLFSASSAKEEAGNGKGGGKGGKKAAGKGGGGKKNAAPKIGAKVERLPPPTGDAATEAIVKHKATLAKLMSNAKDAKEGQQALLLAFESWVCTEHNEPVLPEAPKLIKALCDEGLLDKEMLAEYWIKTVATHASDAVELLEAQAQCKEADEEHVAASEKLKEVQKEDADAAQQAKWAAAEVQNARTGNQPTGDEVAREKAANIADTKARANLLQKHKDIELYHKRQVTALNAQATANNNLAEKTSQMRTCELMHQYGRPFFEPTAAASEVSAGYKAAEVPVVDGAKADSEA